MRPARLTFAAAFVACLAAGTTSPPASQPATQPVNSFTSVREIFTRIPRSEYPSTWVGHEEHLNEWLEKNAIGKPILLRVDLDDYVTLPYHTPSPGSRPSTVPSTDWEEGYVIRVRVVDRETFAFDGHTFRVVVEGMTMPQALHDKIFRVKRGMTVFVIAEIGGIIYMAQPQRNAGMISIKLVNASI